MTALVAEKLNCQSALEEVKSDRYMVQALKKYVFLLTKGTELMIIHRLGLLSHAPAKLYSSPLKTLCAHMEEVLNYEEGEQDSIYMRTFVGIKWPDNSVSYLYAWCFLILIACSDPKS